MKFTEFLEEIEMNVNVLWFSDIFRNVMTEEGWNIIIGNGYYQVCYRAYVETNEGCVINKPIDDTLINIVKEYGWDVNSEGYIKCFDINKLTRNKHLITGNDLGLL